APAPPLAHARRRPRPGPGPRRRGCHPVIRLATSDEMRRADRRATERHGVPSLVLMENAGRGAVDVIERVLGPVDGRRVAVVAGKGQNGGDGFVVARHLAARGALVSVWLAARGGEVGGDAATTLSTLERSGLPATEVTDRPALETLGRTLGEADLVVDGLLGTRVRGPAPGALAGRGPRTPPGGAWGACSWWRARWGSRGRPSSPVAARSGSARAS